MATTPFTAAFEASLKQPNQAGKLTLHKDIVVDPVWFCCISGLGDVKKDPVVNAKPSARKICTLTAVSVDLSGSWAPSSTLSTYEITWGDGNTSNGACPGGTCPAAVAHPGGGYALPGTYTVTVTVTDNAGSTGVVQFQIEAILCIATYFEMFCSVLAGGVWLSQDGGNSWVERNGLDSVLHGRNIFDLKVSPFTKYLYPWYQQELWAAARQHGLYHTFDGGLNWEHVPLPSPTGYAGNVWAYTVLPSKVDPFEIYALAENSASTRVWLYRSADWGMTWTDVELSGASPQYSIAQEGWTHLMDMDAYGTYIFLVALDSVTLSPVIFRYFYDLLGGGELPDGEIYNPGNGVWGGVFCDHNLAYRQWYFGDFSGIGHGFDAKILISDDYGIASLRDVSPTEFQDNDNIVRPSIPSIYYPDELFACEITDLDTGVTTDMGTTWEVSVGTLPFSTHCGERDTFDDYWFFIGRNAVNVAHLQMTPNLGGNWYERSGGIVPNNQEVTSIQITNYYEEIPTW